MQDHASPATAHIQQAHPRTESEFAADEVELLLLRYLERGVGIGEHRARVRHGWPQDPAVEAIGDVVVVMNRLRVAALGVPASSQSPLLGRRCGAFQGLRTECLGQVELVPPRQVRGIEGIQPAEGGVGVADDLEIAADVGACESEL